MVKYVGGDSYRVFINPALGCPAECSYCYLPVKGIRVGQKINDIALADNIIEDVKSTSYFVEGAAGSIISIGCFTECWDASIRGITLDLIRYFLSLGNYVQLATKRYVSPSDLTSISRSLNVKGQLSIFVSCSTYSRADEYEVGATTPSKRLSCIPLLEEAGIPAYLYIKPVIANVTIRDIGLFRECLLSGASGVIVGSMFVPKTGAVRETSLPVSGLEVVEIDDEAEILTELSDVVPVYRNSTLAIEYWREIYEQRQCDSPCG